MNDLLFDPLRILASLRAHGVRFVVVGGFAATVHGSPSITDDVDICIAGDDENLERLLEALHDLGARQLDLGKGDLLSFETVAGRLDCTEWPPGTAGFIDLDVGAVEVHLGNGLHVRAASVEDLLRMKRATATPQDLWVVSQLAAMTEVSEGGV